MKKGIIGSTVQELAERDGKPIPYIVEVLLFGFWLFVTALRCQECIAYLYKQGFDETGLFRVSGEGQLVR